MTQRPVLFDQTAYQAWLKQPTTTPDGESSKYDAIPDLAVGWQRHDGQGGWLAEVLIDALHADDGQQVLTYEAGVSGLRVWSTESPESGADGGVVAEVTVDGVPLSLGYISGDELVRSDWDLMPGYEAAELALTELAGRAADAADRSRRSDRPVGDLFGSWFGSLTGADIGVGLTALADIVNGGGAADLGEPQLLVIDRVMALRAAAVAPQPDNAVIADDEIVDAEIIED